MSGLLDLNSAKGNGWASAAKTKKLDQPFCCSGSKNSNAFVQLNMFLPFGAWKRSFPPFGVAETEFPALLRCGSEFSCPLALRKRNFRPFGAAEHNVFPFGVAAPTFPALLHNGSEHSPPWRCGSKAKSHYMALWKQMFSTCLAFV